MYWYHIQVMYMYVYCWFVHVPLLFFCTGHWFDLQNQPDSQNGNKISSTTMLQHYPEYVCVILNTDGISLFKSSRITVWPVYLQIANLSPSVQFRQDNIITCGLWVGQTKPNMDIILTPILQEISRINNMGFSLMMPEGSKVVRIKLLFGIFDLIAKAQVLKMKQFNGSYGCPTCLHPGEYHSNQVYPPASYPLRTEEKIERAIERGQASGEIIEGIKGKSPLTSYINLVDGVPGDYMHSVLEGVVNWLLKAWTDSKYHNKPFSIRRSLDRLDQALLQQRPPHEFTRSPRSIKCHLSYWKASEFRYWLLFYSLPLLLNVLPPLYLHHFALLVCSMHLLLQKELSVIQCHAAEEMLQDFYNFLPELYGLSSCTMNAHSLIHLPYFVQQWGPLWTHSAFSFESMNGTLTNMIHSTRKIAEQLSFSLDVKLSLQEIYNHLETRESDELINYLNYSGSPTRAKMTKMKYGYAIGAIVISDLSLTEYSEVQKLCQGTSRQLPTFSKAFYDGMIFHSAATDDNTKRNSSLCCYKSASDIHAECFGEIQKFAECPILGTIVFIKQFSQSQSSILKATGNPCRQILEQYAQISLISQFIIEIFPLTSDSISCILMSDIISNCVLIEPALNSSKYYIVKLPNNYEHY